MPETTIAIIGAGNMGASLLGGLIAHQFDPSQLWITDSEIEKLNHLKSQFHIHISTDNIIAITQADVIIMAVKPQIISSVLKAMADIIQKQKPLVISLAAGIEIKKIQLLIGENVPIVRTMPNIPALIQCGATAAIGNQWVTEQDHHLAETILMAIGLVVWVKKEALLDTITALSGSGPAYFFLLMEALQNAAVELGIPADIARKLTLQTAYGASKMALESNMDVVELRQKVTSPNGTTEQAIAVFEKNKIREICKKALNAAKKRSEELAKING